MAPEGKKNSKLSGSGIDKPRVNLGLTELVASLNKEASEDKSSPSTLIESKEKSADELIVSLEALADKKDWKALAQLAHQRMSSPSGSEGIVATIWWGIANLETGGIPSAILSTPVSKASSEVERFASTTAGSLVQPELSSARIKKETASLLIRLAKKNLGSLSDKSVPEFLERALKLDASVCEDVKSLIERESDRLSKMTGRKKHRDERVASFSAVLKLCDEIGLKSSTKPELRVENVIVSPQAPRGRSRRVTAAVGLFLFVIVAVYFNRHRFISSDSTFVGVASFANDSSDAALKTSVSERIKTVDNLEVLLAKVNSIAVPKVTQNSPVLGRANPEPENISTNTDPQQIVVSRSGREQIDTSGPIEGTVFYGADRRQQEGESQSVFGSEPPGVGGLIPEGSKPSSMGGPGVYRILTYTRVYSKASYFSQTIANLESGSRVQVVEKFGDWLKIRSKGGQIGFILSQDAERVD